MKFVDQYIAQAKFTVLLRPSGILQITGGPFELAGSNIKSTIEVSTSLTTTLTSSLTSTLTKSLTSALTSVQTFIF